MGRTPIQQKRDLPDRRRRDRRAARRRLKPVPVPVERRKGVDRRQSNRRGGVRRAADTLTAKKKIYERSRRAR
jgi:hypothetical protein